MVSVFFLFFIGLAIGSFSNAVIYRLDSKEGLLLARSHCPKCHHLLNWLDLFPVVSFVFLRGKCRYCHKSISWQYPLVELLTAALYALIAGRVVDNSLSLVFWLLATFFLVVIFVYDLKHYIIPDEVVYPAIILTFAYRLFEAVKSVSWSASFVPYLVAAVGAAGFFFLIVFISKEKWMGFGDVKLALFLGLLLGWPNTLLALFCAFLIGAIIGTGLIASGLKKMKSELPFAPFLITGTVITIFFGEQIFNWYFSLLL